MAFAEFNQLLSATRPQQGQYVDGIWVDSPKSNYTLSTSVQPISPTDVEMFGALLPEGRRVNNSFSLYSTQEMQLWDQVLIRGSWYEILYVAPWQNNIVPHYKAIAVKMQEEGRT
jgi:hypothetical protein